MHREWFEPALAEHLDRVVAPDELWERIQRPRVKAARVPIGVNAARLCACAALALILLMIPWQRGVRSGDAAEIRGWVRAKAGIDVPLRAYPAGVQLIGANASRGSVEIAYRVSNRDGRLFIGGRHAASSGKVFTGSIAGHTFTLECATPEDLRIACNLCHIG